MVKNSYSSSWQRDLAELRYLASAHPYIVDASSAPPKPTASSNNRVLSIVNSMTHAQTFDYLNIEYEPLRKVLKKKGYAKPCIPSPVLSGYFILKNVDAHNKIDADIVTLRKGACVYKGGNYFFDPRDCPPSDGVGTWVGSAETGAIYAQRYHGGITSYVMKRDASFLSLTERSIRWLLNHATSDEDAYAIQAKWGVGLKNISEQIALIHQVLPNHNIRFFPSQHRIFPNCAKYSAGDLYRSFGNGRTDRLAAHAVINVLMSYTDARIDGWYSPMTSSLLNNASMEEILVFGGPGCPLQENPRDPLHWRNWVHSLEKALSEGGPSIDVRLNYPNKFVFDHETFGARNFMIPRFIRHIRDIWPDNQFDIAYTRKSAIRSNHDLAIHAVNSLRNINQLKGSHDTLREILELHTNASIVLLQAFPSSMQKDLSKIIKTEFGGKWRVKGYVLDGPEEDYGNDRDDRLHILLVSKGIRVSMMKRPQNIDMIQAGAEHAILTGVGHKIVIPSMRKGVSLVDKFSNPLPIDEFASNLKENTEQRTAYLESIVSDQSTIVMSHIEQDVDGSFVNALKKMGFMGKTESNSARNTVTDLIMCRSSPNSNVRIGLLPYPFTGYLPVVATLR